VNDEWERALRESRNEDGGWGTRAGLPSNTESTALAILALAAVSAAVDEPIRAAGARWLREHQAADGSWPYARGLPAGSWSSSLAVLAIGAGRDDRSAAQRGISWLIGEKGRSPSRFDRFRSWLLGNSPETGMDLQLKGWPWAPGTFSWVEPTAYAIVALGRLAPADNDAVRRVEEGRRMILDRTCPGGGWNYGNAKVLGEELRPYPDTTALGLIGLQGVESTPAIDESMGALARMMADYHSGLTLSLSAICHRIYGRDPGSLIERLEIGWDETAFMGETRTTALAVIASAGGSSPFEIAAHV
jgi:hypothetical protein